MRLGRRIGYKTYDLLDRIHDVEAALKAECWHAALALALTIPDICGRVYTASEKNRKNRYRYSKWFDDFVNLKYGRYRFPDGEKHYFNGELCYFLRCAFLHSGNSDVDYCDEVEDTTYKTTIELSFRGTSISAWYVDDKGEQTTVESEEGSSIIEISIVELCENICFVAKQFYLGHPNRELFNDYCVEIMDKIELPIIVTEDDLKSLPPLI